jgi:hypothetical protein
MTAVENSARPTGLELVFVNTLSWIPIPNPIEFFSYYICRTNKSRDMCSLIKSFRWVIIGRRFEAQTKGEAFIALL